MKLFVLLIAAAVLAGATEKKVAMKDLPPAVQKTVLDQTKGAEIEGLSMETENGKTTYEVETVVNGKHRDLEIDAQGAVTEVEEETALDSLPPAAKTAIEKKAAGGKITMVETVTRGAAIAFYEAHFTARDGKKHEVQVKPDGAAVKE
jgi:uncharacterized membrane protein YkoI